MEIELKDLAGAHLLDTAAIVSTLPPQDSWFDERVCVSFGMDGKTYTAIEDPSDGYRSYLSGITVQDGHSELLKGASAIGRKVVATHEDSEPDGEYERGRDLLTITDAETGHVWLVIGTKNTDDYYPYCVLEWIAMQPLTQ